MKDDRLLLGIDIGTSSSKGVLVSLDGRLVAEHSIPHGFDIPQPGWAEQDADAVWWHDFCQISRGLIAQAGIDPARIAGVASSAIGPTMLPLDENGRPLRPSILYGIDTRAGQEIDDLTAELGEDEIFARTGHALSAQSVGPKVLWYRRHQPDLYARTSKIVTASTYLVFRLTGRYVVDNYVAPYFTPFFDVHQMAWHKAWVERICPLEWLPDTLWSAEQAGVVTAEASRETGIPVGTPVRSWHGGRALRGGCRRRHQNRRSDGHVWHHHVLDSDHCALSSAPRSLGISTLAARKSDTGCWHVDIGRLAHLVS